MDEYGRRTGYLIITDVGSTTTKAMLLRRGNGGRLEPAAESRVPTTVEKPFEDVCIGVGRAVERLEAATGEKLSRGGGMPAVPYLSTSSAGGGLQMIVFGLTSVETGRIAENTASNAGGVVLRTISIDDDLQAVEQMMIIQDLHPDMIMLAGGTDGGAIAGVVRLAEILALSNPRPKFRQDMKIPLVYCGNSEARSFVGEILEEVFEVHAVDNVRPSLEETNMEPARREVHRLFMENVMERAPGYSKLKPYVISDILPTPAGVENIMRLYSERTGENVLMIDMGGATTDVFSCITGEYNRTVAANTGMSYSISNILRRSGMERVTGHLPGTFTEDAVRDYIYNKTICPTYVPSTPGEVLTEQAVAICGIETSWREHLDASCSTVRAGFMDRMRARVRKEFEETFSTSKNSTFSLSDIDIIIGSGGVISHAARDRAFWMLAEGFRPYGVTCLAVDRDFRAPHLGILSEIDGDEALRIFQDRCMERTGWVVAPFGDFDEGDRVLSVRDLDTGGVTVLDYGGLLYLPRGGNLEFRPESDASLGNSDDRLLTELPVLVDCRNRGEKASGVTLAGAGAGAFSHGEVREFSSSMDPGHGGLETGEWEREYRLPYSGSIMVETGDRVEPGSVLGENRYSPPRLYIIDLNRIPGYDRHLSPEEIRDGLLVSEGDRIRMDQPLYEVHRKGLTGFDFTFRSTVGGMVTRIEKNGIIIVREIQDYDGKPHEVDIAGPLGIRPGHIGAYLKRKEGDFVESDQVLASDISAGRAVMVKSPTTGLIRKVDRRNGTVTVQYELKPVRMVSHVSGEVAEIFPEQGVRLRGSGPRLTGRIGFGGETSGTLAEMIEGASSPSDRGRILFTAKPVDLDTLRSASDAGVAGMIAPTIPASDWYRYLGSELGVAVTGDEGTPFTLVLTAGFGLREMDGECSGLLRGSVGKRVCISGRTQIRAGVTRPWVML
ncbi:MAG: hypothetical protein AVO35_07740 [Candidatus Aegiribacteria sp. MLS_C]|nr:MAG: hypothetical protein AVO35_07740 [Candidatus Aegiribacteria sp. MLS_C]